MEQLPVSNRCHTSVKLDVPHCIDFIILYNSLNKNHLENIILVKCKNHIIFFFILDIVLLLISNSDVAFLILLNGFLL